MQWDIARHSFRVTLTAIRDHQMYVQLPREFSGYLLNGQSWTPEENGLYFLTLDKGCAAQITNV